MYIKTSHKLLLFVLLLGGVKRERKEETRCEEEEEAEEDEKNDDDEDAKEAKREERKELNMRQCDSTIISVEKQKPSNETKDVIIGAVLGDVVTEYHKSKSNRMKTKAKKTRRRKKQQA